MANILCKDSQCANEIEMKYRTLIKSKSQPYMYIICIESVVSSCGAVYWSYFLDTNP